MQEYTNIDQQIHQLSQIVAKVNRTFIQAKADDSHTNLSFDFASHRVYGRWISTNADKVILALNVETFSFEWVNKSLKVIQSHPIQNKTILELEKSISDGLADLGLKSKGFTDDLHFEIPKYDFVNEPFKKWDDQDIKNWQTIRNQANVASFELLGYLQVSSEIRMWPHHFDTGFYVQPTNDLGVGFGLAMSDSLLNEPYYYMSGLGLNGAEIDYSAVGNLAHGKWITTDNFNGALLPLSELNENTSDKIRSFSQEALSWFLEVEKCRD